MATAIDCTTNIDTPKPYAGGWYRDEGSVRIYAYTADDVSARHIGFHRHCPYCRQGIGHTADMHNAHTGTALRK